MKRQLTQTMSIPRLKKNVPEMNVVAEKVGYLSVATKYTEKKVQNLGLCPKRSEEVISET